MLLWRSPKKAPSTHREAGLWHCLNQERTHTRLFFSGAKAPLTIGCAPGRFVRRNAFPTSGTVIMIYRYAQNATDFGKKLRLLNYLSFLQCWSVSAIEKASCDSAGVREQRKRRARAFSSRARLRCRRTSASGLSALSRILICGLCVSSPVCGGCPQACHWFIRLLPPASLFPGPGLPSRLAGRPGLAHPSVRRL